MSNEHLSLVSNRSHLTSRNSIEVLVKYARNQDSKIRTAQIRRVKAGFLFNTLWMLPLSIYVTHAITLGYWRSFYPTSMFSSFMDVAHMRLREYFVPEIYLKERQKRKIEVKLKETEELRQIWHK